MLTIRSVFWSVTLGFMIATLAATSTLADSHEKSTGEEIGEASREAVDATKEGYESSKKWATETSSDVADATKEGYEESKEWVKVTSSDVADATKEGYEDAKEGTKNLAEDVEQGYNNKDE